MKKTLNWKKKTFSSTYRIYSGDRQVGQLVENSLKQSAIGELNNKKYLFRTKGLMKQETEVIDIDSKSTIGKISYNTMMNKAEIQYPNRTVHWKYDNKWQTRWSLSDSGGMHMDFRGGLSKGSIECSDEDDLLVLTGLFVTNFYWQMTIVIMVAVFLPIWATLVT